MGALGRVTIVNYAVAVCTAIALSPGLPDFLHVTLKNMGRPGDEATQLEQEYRNRLVGLVRSVNTMSDQLQATRYRPCMLVGMLL